MSRLIASCCALLVLLTLGVGPVVLADPAPFCSGEGAPVLAQSFIELQARLGERSGQAVECEHTEAATGDLQQHTSAGLFYLRRVTGTPTFTDGAEHWALRDGQVLHWTSQGADPPDSAEIVALPDTTAVPAASTALSNSAAAAAVAPSTASTVPWPVLTIVVGLLLCAAIAIALQARRRSQASPGAAGRGSAQLIAASASAPAGGLVSTGRSPLVPTVPVQELESTIVDIGKDHVTEQADAVQRLNPEAMIWQGSPAALAMLAPRVFKWLIVRVVALVLSSWLASLLGAGAASPSASNMATAVETVIVGLTLLWIAWSAATAVLRLRATKYRATRQRLELTSGVFGQTSITRELYALGDAVIRRPFHYRIFGVGDLLLSDRTKGPVLL